MESYPNENEKNKGKGKRKGNKLASLVESSTNGFSLDWMADDKIDCEKERREMRGKEGKLGNELEGRKIFSFHNCQ